jgi:nitrogen regulatory protein PII
VKKVEAIIHPEKLNEVKNVLSQNGIVGLNVVNVTGRRRRRASARMGRSSLIPVEQVIRVRTGERGTDAL